METPSIPKVILVTGATGKQGGAVIEALLDQNKVPFAILAVTRDASTPRAQKLAERSPDIKLVRGNLDNIDELWKNAQAAAGSKPIDSVYSVQVSEGPGVTTDGEVAQGKALIDKAIDKDVKMFVYSSVERGGDEESWENETPIPHFKTKYLVEHHLRRMTEPGNRGAKMMWTILRPVAFMDNLHPDFQTKVFLTALRNYLDENKKIQWVAKDDVGVFATKAFLNPCEWDQKAVGLAGDELDMDGMEAAFNSAGLPFPKTFWLFGSILTTLIKELRLMIGWFASDGYKADVSQRREEHPELMNLEQWLRTKSLFRS